MANPLPMGYAQIFKEEKPQTLRPILLLSLSKCAGTQREHMYALARACTLTDAFVGCAV